MWLLIFILIQGGQIVKIEDYGRYESFSKCYVEAGLWTMHEASKDRLRSRGYKCFYVEKETL